MIFRGEAVFLVLPSYLASVVVLVMDTRCIKSVYILNLKPKI